jgi:RNA methyltransferase, TrmH family
VPQYLSKSHLTTYRKLAQKKYRDQYRLFIIEGLRAVEQVLAGGKVIIEAIITTENAEFDAGRRDINRYILTEEDFKSLSDTQNSQGILAICHMTDEADMDLMVTGNGVIVAMDRIQDPGNLGTIIRSATWFQCTGLLLGDGTVDYYNPKVVRSTAGAVGVVPLINASLSEALPIFQANGWEVVLLDTSDEAIPLNKLAKSDKILIVVGNEGAGISNELLKSGYTNVFISGDNNHVESLNASVASSIALFHLFSINS